MLAPSLSLPPALTPPLPPPPWLPSREEFQMWSVDLYTPHEPAARTHGRREAECDEQQCDSDGQT